MAVESLLNLSMGEEGNLSLWSFAHASHHQQIVREVGQKIGLSLSLYELDPINIGGIRNWLFRHQKAHNEFNSVLGLSGDDLDVDVFDKPKELNAWLWQHFQEHLAAQKVLGF